MANFDALNREWERIELSRYLDSLDRYEADKEMEAESECRDCSQRGPKCFQCGFGYGG